MYGLIRPLLMKLDPEAAHRATLALLKTGLAPTSGFAHPSLETKVFGIDFPNPLGLAAGFDKEGEALQALLCMGFGFVEAGTVTPRPQPGNPRPRVFRDIGNRSVINRMGFPGNGIAPFKKNIEAFRAKQKGERGGIVGLNIGINKETVSAIDDYKQGIAELSGLADYVVINVSSPNTAGLRNLQAKDELEKLLSSLACPVPLILKIAPDLDMQQKADIASVVLSQKIDGLIVSNTTVSRPDKLAAALKEEKGGLSGELLKPLALQALSDIYALTEGKIPLIAAGGVSSAEDAYARIRAGASLVQIYTGLIYNGPALIPRILEGLVDKLAKDGFAQVSQAVGTGQKALKKVV